MRLWQHMVFIAGYTTAFWQYFEWAHRLYRHGLIEHPVWSGTFWAPTIHHGYYGYIALIAIYFMATLEDYKKKLTHIAETGFTFNWEFTFAITIMLCATIALVFSDFSSDNWIHVLTLIISFLTGMGYGYLKLVKKWGEKIEGKREGEG